MKWICLISLPTLLLCSAQQSDAGLRMQRRQKAAWCDCAPAACCRPTIVKPCHTNVYCYQVRLACQKPRCCDTCCAPASCCAPTVNCAPATSCDPAACAASTACDFASQTPVECCSACVPSGDVCCDLPCSDDCCLPSVCAEDCKLAALIYESQTACYPRQRKRAVHRLGDKYQCECAPEVMSALVYALNDADPYVRRKAADEIGDQLRRNPCCCSPCVVSALTGALADCDRGTRKEAEQALKLCGYDVVDGCCQCVCDADCCCFGFGSDTPVMESQENNAPVMEPQEQTPAAPQADEAEVSARPASMIAPAMEVAPAPPVEASEYFRTKRKS